MQEMPNYTLHEAMRIVLSEAENKTMHAAGLADEIYRRRLYLKKDGSKAEYTQIRARCGHVLHRFNDTMAEVFYSAIQDIKVKYNGDASRIWSNNPSSAKVVYEFLQFKGSGKKIATMAANILARQFKIPFSDYYSIDISPDVHILRVMRRTGLVDSNADLDSIIYKEESC